MTDAQMRALWANNLSAPRGIDDKTAKQNCDEWMTRKSYKDSDSITGVPAVQHCRSVTINGVACDLPNVQELMLMFLEADAIDSLDPTVAQYPTYALGSANTAGFWNFGGAKHASSSTESDGYSVRSVEGNGKCQTAYKYSEIGVAPVLEI
jgi:hypothetical protein